MLHSLVKTTCVKSADLDLITLQRNIGCKKIRYFSNQSLDCFSEIKEYLPSTQTFYFKVINDHTMHIKLYYTYMFTQPVAYLILVFSLSGEMLPRPKSYSTPPFPAKKPLGGFEFPPLLIGQINVSMTTVALDNKGC